MKIKTKYQHNRKTTVIQWLILILLLVCAHSSSGETIEKVVRILDGDTLDVVLQNGATKRLRLISVNTEERYAIAPCGRAWSKRATEALTALVASGPLWIVWDVQRLDAYGRMLVYLYDGDTFVNEAMLLKGLAIYSSAGKNVAQRSVLRAAYATAQREKIGMFAE